jgi:hypothetical protein
MSATKRAAASASKRQEQLAKIGAVRAHVGPAAARLDDRQLLKLISLCGSVGLACDAILMIPQPKFLNTL